MSIKNRLEKLEAQDEKKYGKPSDVAMMKPSEILARCDELITNGAQPTTDERARIESLRQVVK